MTDPQKFHVSIEADVTISPILPPVPPILPYGLHLLPQGVTPTIVELDALQWIGVHDDATSGTAAGVTAYPVTIGGKQARAFPNQFTNNGGMRYHCIWGHDPAWRHTIFAGDIWVASGGPGFGQFEWDGNQVINIVNGKGKTVIYGVQCDQNTGTWMITIQDPHCRWISTAYKGNPATWPTGQWLHIETLCHRDDAGLVTYDAIYFNGATMPVNQALPSMQDLGWGNDCLVNVQIGGKGSGSVLVYGSNLLTARW